MASPGRDVPIRRPEQPEDNNLAQPRSNSLKDVCVRAHKDSLTTATTLTVKLSMYKLRVSEVQSTCVLCHEQTGFVGTQAGMQK